MMRIAGLTFMQGKSLHGIGEIFVQRIKRSIGTVRKEIAHTRKALQCSVRPIIEGTQQVKKIDLRSDVAERPVCLKEIFMTRGSSMNCSRRVRSTASSRRAPPTTATTLSEPDDLAASVSNSMTPRVYSSSRSTAQVMMHPIFQIGDWLASFGA